MYTPRSVRSKYSGGEKSRTAPAVPYRGSTNRLARRSRNVDESRVGSLSSVRWGGTCRPAARRRDSRRPWPPWTECHKKLSSQGLASKRGETGCAGEHYSARTGCRRTGPSCAQPATTKIAGHSSAKGIRRIATAFGTRHQLAQGHGPTSAVASLYGTGNWSNSLRYVVGMDNAAPLDAREN